jgi:C1A family cysteine protease
LVLQFATAMNLPKAVNWENEGVLTSVKNQGRDAYCAMHASIASMESLITIQNRKNDLMDTSDPAISLSHQYLVHYFADKYIEK